MDDLFVIASPGVITALQTPARAESHAAARDIGERKTNYRTEPGPRQSGSESCAFFARATRAACTCAQGTGAHGRRPAGELAFAISFSLRNEAELDLTLRERWQNKIRF